MEIIELPEGQEASEESDCIKIIARANGVFRLEGSVLQSCGDGEEAESVALVDGGEYKTADEAESAGLAWANSHCPERLYVSRIKEAAT